MNRPDDAAPCIGCQLLKLALPQLGPDPWPVLTAMVDAAVARGSARADVAVVCGAPALLPPDVPRRGPFVLCVVEREKFLAQYRATRWAPALAALAEPAPEGHAWVWIAAGTPDRGAVVLLRHRLWPVTQSAAHAVALSLVPEDGGPAPGAGASRGGAA